MRAEWHCQACGDSAATVNCILTASAEALARGIFGWALQSPFGDTHITVHKRGQPFSACSGSRRSATLLKKTCKALKCPAWSPFGPRVRTTPSGRASTLK